VGRLVNFIKRFLGLDEGAPRVLPLFDMTPKNTSPQPALMKVPAREAKRLRLFLFTHAGSGAYPYRPLLSALPAWVEASITQLPGREASFGAPMFKQMSALVAALLPVLRPELEGPTIFVGHSLGAHVAFEVIRALRAASAPLPKALVTSGIRAPHLPLRREPIHALPLPRFIESLRKFGGTPEVVLQNQELMELLLPPLRADLEILETYRYTPGEPLSLPITSFGGRTDGEQRVEDIEAWREHTTGPFTSKIFEGGHFYLFEKEKPLFLRALEEVLLSARG